MESRSAAEPASRSRLILDQFSLLVIVSWLSVMVPRLMDSILSAKYRTSVGDQLEGSNLAIYAQRGFNALIVIICVLAIGQRVRNLPAERGLALVVMLAPWVFMVSRDFYDNHYPKVSGSIYPFLVIAIWAIRPPLKRLALLGYLTGLGAGVSLLLALLLPAKGLFTSSLGTLIAPEKQILPWGILIGMFPNGNNLGEFLVLGLPAIAFIRHRGHQSVILALSAYSLVWSSSRSSIAALAAIIAVVVVLAGLRVSGRGAMAAVLMLGAFGAMIFVPLTATSAGAFTNRGYIWQTSLAAWAPERWAGLGSTWYSRIGQFANALPGTAFHGHNLFIHSLVIGGIVYVALLGLMLVCVGYFAVAWAVRGVSFPAAFMVAFFVSSTLEVSSGLVDRGFMLVVTAIPMATFAFARLPPSPLAAPDPFELIGTDANRSPWSLERTPA